MKILIFGCSGQDGSILTELLLENQDFEVVCIFRGEPNFLLSRLNSSPNPRLKKLVCDITDSSRVASILLAEAPDVVVNFSALSYVPDSFSGDDVFNVNLEGFRNILRYSNNATKIVSAGSLEALAVANYLSLSPLEKHLKPSPYSFSKYFAWAEACEARIRQKRPITTLLFGSHTSSLQKTNFLIPKIINGAKNWRNSGAVLYIGNITSKRDWSWAYDAMRDVVSVIECDAFDRDHYVVSQNVYSVRTVVEIVYREFGIELNFDGSGSFYDQNDMLVVKCSAQHVRNYDYDHPIIDNSINSNRILRQKKLSVSEFIAKMVAEQEQLDD